MESPDGPFVIAHLSDLHVGEVGTLMDELLAPADRLGKVVQRLVRMGDDLDAVLVSGDLVDGGSRAEYERLAELLAPLGVPLVLAAGNHDDPAVMAEVFADVRHRPSGAVAGDRDPVGAGFTVEDWPLRIVVLDSTVQGLHSGAFTAARLEHLDARLTERPDWPTVVVVHHPPVEVGMWWMDYGAPPGSDVFESVIGRHAQVVAVAAGHIHRSTQCAWAGTLLTVAGSSVYQSQPALSADPPPLVCDDEAPVALLRWDGRRLVVHQLDQRSDSRILDLRDVIRPWEDYERAARNGGPMLK